MTKIENFTGLSALDKVKAKKQEAETQRLLNEKLKKDQEEQENKAKVSTYEQEKAVLSGLIARKDEILGRREEIKLRRGKIIDVGHTAVQEARQDEEVEAILHTPEGFSDVFSTEKEEWQNLRNEINELNTELQELEKKISEKEKLVENLYGETKEGKAVLTEKQEADRKEYMDELKKTIQQQFESSIAKSQKYNYSLNNFFDNNNMYGVRERLNGVFFGNLELPKIENVPEEDYYNAFTEYLYEGFFKGKSIESSEDIKNEIQKTLEYGILKQQYGKELLQAQRKDNINRFVAEKEEVIIETRLKLKAGLDDLVSKCRNLLMEMKTSQEYREQFSDIKLDGYEKLIPATGGEVTFSLYDYESSRFDIPFMKRLSEQMSADRETIHQKQKEVKDAIEKKEKTFLSFGVDKLKKELENLKAKEAFHYNWLRNKIDIDFVRQLSDIKIEKKQVSRINESTLAREVSMLINEFSRLDPKAALGDGNYPDFQKEINFATVYDAMIPHEVPNKELLEKERQLYDKIREFRAIVDAKVR